MSGSWATAGDAISADAGAEPGGRARAAATFVAATFGRLVDKLNRGRGRFSTGTASGDDASNDAITALDDKDVLDDLELRFRALEGGARRRARTSRAQRPTGAARAQGSPRA